MSAIGKRVGMNAKARNKVIRLVAARLTWLELTFSRLGSVDIWLYNVHPTC
jgi:hypothetical protein